MFISLYYVEEGMGKYNMEIISYNESSNERM